MKHKACTLIWLAFVMLALGCSDSTEPKSDLVANLELSVNLRQGYLPLTVDFVLDPTATQSAVDPVDSLEIRWDIDGDGIWESDFRPLRMVPKAHLPHMPTEEWSAICEVRDSAGNRSVVLEKMVLPPWVPRGSDLVVGDLILANEYMTTTHSDTLSSASTFYIQLPARMWGDYTATRSILRCFIDGELASEEWVDVYGPFFPILTPLSPQGPFQGLEPGMHLIEAEFLVNPGLVDVDPTNNKRSGTFVWTGGDT